MVRWILLTDMPREKRKYLLCPCGPDLARGSVTHPVILQPEILLGDTGPELQPQPGKHTECLLRMGLMPRLRGPVYTLTKAQRG